jgi:beta-glucoside operon transcriptional antiterminator
MSKWRKGLNAMRVEKVINNNIISSFDEKGREVVVMGKGLGFKVRPGYVIDTTKIEKVFRMETDTESEQLKALLKEVPLEHIQISNQIVSYAKKIINKKLSRNIYITLTDHIDFAIQRVEDGIILKNALAWEIKKFYPEEFKVGIKALEMIDDTLGIKLPHDEAASIALHFVNAELSGNMSNTLDITKIIQNALNIVKYHYQIELKEDSLHYERFITHLKFFSQRMFLGERIQEEDSILKDMVKHYQKAYDCAQKIKDYMRNVYSIEVTEGELIYLTVHIQRVTMV